MKLKALLLGATLALTSGCASVYQAKIDNQHRCERTSVEDFKLFKENELLVEKVSRLNDVFDFYDKETKVGRLSLLPDGTFKWKSKEKLPIDIYTKIKKCEETLENKYEINFLTTEEWI